MDFLLWQMNSSPDSQERLDILKSTSVRFLENYFSSNLWEGEWIHTKPIWWPAGHNLSGETTTYDIYATCFPGHNRCPAMRLFHEKIDASVAELFASMPDFKLLLTTGQVRSQVREDTTRRKIGIHRRSARLQEKYLRSG